MNIINIEHISKIFGEKTIFRDASFGIHAGDKIGIVGINGTGKTTLLRMIAGLEEPDEGQIVRQNNLKIAYLPQNPEFPAELQSDSGFRTVKKSGKCRVIWNVWESQNMTRTLNTCQGDREGNWHWQRYWHRISMCCFWMSPPTIWTRL